MGKSPRRKPVRLGGKLRQIRTSFQVSQDGILVLMDLADEYTRNNVSNFELNRREPPLYLLLQYARIAGICLDLLADDSADLPSTLPGIPVHSGVQTAIPGRRGAKN